MRTRSPLLTALVLAAMVFLVVPKQAHAYIDPGSGSLIWQILLATLLSGLFLVKTYWHRLKQIVNHGQVPQEEGTEELDDDQQQD